MNKKKDIVILKIWLNGRRNPIAVIECSNELVRQLKNDLADEELSFIDLDGFIFAKKDFNYATVD